MTVSVADIERWQPGDVREVFHATRNRAEAAFEAADGIASLPAFGTWGGDAAAAAKHANEALRKDLDAHGNESLTVAKAAQRAADDMQQVKNDLATLQAEAVTKGYQIDPATSRVVPGPRPPSAPMIVAIAEMGDLQSRLDGLLTRASAVDQELAQAINMATGASEIPDMPHDNRPEIQQALSRPLPQDPEQFEDLWEQLTDEEKDWLYAQDHSIGNHGGMPFEDRDTYNRLHLDDLQQATADELARLRAQHPDWAAGDNPFMDSQEWRTWKSQWDSAITAQQGYQEVEQALQSPNGMPRFLGTLDDRGHAAVSINNPDTAKRNATFVPGTGQDLTRLQFSTDKSQRMLEAALTADPTLSASDVSVTTWMGYDRPMNVVTEAPATSYAHNGAQALDDFQAGLRASHNDALAGGESINTVIGHSYGSTLVGAAALDGHHLDADNVVAVGSPGVLAEHAGDLNLDPGAHVYATRAYNDIIGVATYASLGPDPMAAGFGGIPFEAAPGPAGPFGAPTTDAHSSYWTPGNAALVNMGRIIAGQSNVTPPTFTP
ncbi:alpha/beta hydrolase family protein [Mycobacterium sp. MYCO198283]|uniref:alpha/beta hydrolase n=1 Tax=Mycobacterium sp. MYCO198283 TaxID=2883505 RepID=UPI001E376DCE|nr:alpha/beta hydrolase [Mycobacterium sp. MYCO198283]MCG5433561.1 alpha/beta hydrolase family protein [Mycobacterium sp. MYCO198283]